LKNKFKIKIKMKITPAEIDLLFSINGSDYQIEEISRRSDKEFDLYLRGQAGDKTYSFSSWLPLHVIRETDYTRYAEFSDYPEMVRAGDWSGIRDSSPDKIWAIFEKSLKDRGLY
jgi:hypothetical protein